MPRYRPSIQARLWSSPKRSSLIPANSTAGTVLRRPPLSCSAHKVFPAIAVYAQRLSAPVQNPLPLQMPELPANTRPLSLAIDTTALTSAERQYLPSIRWPNEASLVTTKHRARLPSQVLQICLLYTSP